MGRRKCLKKLKPNAIALEVLKKKKKNSNLKYCHVDTRKNEEKKGKSVRLNRKRQIFIKQRK